MITVFSDYYTAEYAVNSSEHIIQWLLKIKVFSNDKWSQYSVTTTDSVKTSDHSIQYHSIQYSLITSDYSIHWSTLLQYSTGVPIQGSNAMRQASRHVRQLVGNTDQI